jgi:hypothetical protein
MNHRASATIHWWVVSWPFLPCGLHPNTNLAPDFIEMELEAEGLTQSTGQIRLIDFSFDGI